MAIVSRGIRPPRGADTTVSVADPSRTICHAPRIPYVSNSCLILDGPRVIMSAASTGTLVRAISCDIQELFRQYCVCSSASRTRAGISHPWRVFPMHPPHSAEPLSRSISLAPRSPSRSRRARSTRARSSPRWMTPPDARVSRRGSHSGCPGRGGFWTNCVRTGLVGRRRASRSGCRLLRPKMPSSCHPHRTAPSCA